MALPQILGLARNGDTTYIPHPLWEPLMPLHAAQERIIYKSVVGAYAGQSSMATTTGYTKSHKVLLEKVFADYGDSF